MKHVKLYEELSHPEEMMINGCGLFSLDSDLKDELKLEIFKWYQKLSDKDREYVNTLRDESYQDALNAGD